MVVLFGVNRLSVVAVAMKSDCGSFVPLGIGKHEMLGDTVEADFYLLSSDIAIVFHRVDNRLCFCIVLLVSDVLFMPLNSLYCADYDVGVRVRVRVRVRA